MTDLIIGGLGFAALISGWWIAPRVAKRIARERRDAIERHSHERGEP